ncbi:MAG TPA: cupin domain-containing protein [Gaiellaceae bacterium]|nr:cupin domain-containing protein [Gaiellaceae bacterium]
MAYRAVHVDDVETQRGVIKFMRRELGTEAFGINQFDLPPGAEGLEHDHSDSGQEEVYVILAGSGVMRIDGDEVPLRRGLYLTVSADAVRQPVAGPEGLSWVCVGAVPGGGYEPRGPF